MKIFFIFCLVFGFSLSLSVLYESNPFPFPNDLNVAYFSGVKLLSFNSTVIGFAEGHVGDSTWICYTVSNDLGRTWGKVLTLSVYNEADLKGQMNAVPFIQKVGTGKNIISVQFLDLYEEFTYQVISTDLGATWSEGFSIPQQQLAYFAVAPAGVVDAKKNNGGVYYCGQIYAKSGHKSRIYKMIDEFNFEPLTAPSVDLFDGTYCQIISGEGFLTMIYTNISDSHHFYSTSSSDKGKTWSQFSMIDIQTFPGTFSVKKIGAQYVLAHGQALLGGNYGNLTLFSSPRGKNWSYYGTVTPGASGDVDVVEMSTGFGVIYQNGLLHPFEDITFRAYI